jgi:hypothetical protein
VIEAVGVAVDVEVEAVARVGVDPADQVVGDLIGCPDDDPVPAGDVLERPRRAVRRVCL